MKRCPHPPGNGRNDGKAESAASMPTSSDETVGQTFEITSGDDGPAVVHAEHSGWG